jgi:hypothetical protein
MRLAGGDQLVAAELAEQRRELAFELRPKHLRQVLARGRAAHAQAEDSGEVEHALLGEAGKRGGGRGRGHGGASR